MGGTRKARPAVGSGAPLKRGCLRSRMWKRFLKGPDPALLEEFYVPALSQAVRYDRCCAYFSSTVLAAAARGFGRLIERLCYMGEKAPRPAVRLVVNEELNEEDVRALTETGDLSKLEVLLQKRLKNPKEILEKQRLAMLGWLVKTGLLEVRVGVMRRGEGILHAKFGIMTDEAGDAVVFSGSGNESAQGLKGNYEHIEISTSWEDPDRHKEYAKEFESLWKDTHPDVLTVTLPEALRLRLIKLAPKEPPVVEPSNAVARQKAAMLWRYIVEAPFLPNGEVACDATAMVDLWPHQRKVVEETARAWPQGRLLCDEVGMGKTIEAILILRRLMAGRGVRRALILLPAGLVRQWETELREKGGLVAPRLEGLSTLIWPDGRTQKVQGLAQALEQDLLLMSRETARTENNLAVLLAAQPWDLVVLDESHAARRKKQEEGEFNSPTLLLNLLRRLQLQGKARGFLLLSATPMQTHPWEPWDLMAVLGEGGRWLAEFSAVRDFYSAIAALEKSNCDIETARRAASVIMDDPSFPKPPGSEGSELTESFILNNLAFVPPTKRKEIVQWLRKGSPFARRMHRNTKETLRSYHQKGLLESPPPVRKVEDIVFDFHDPSERRVYNAVTAYIEKRFAELEQEKPGKGFVMTVYRRRASSSPLALERSLERRREGLLKVLEEKAHEFELLPKDAPDRLDADELPEEEGGLKISAALPQDPKTAQMELHEVDQLLEDLKALGGKDTKRDEFFDVVKKITDDGRTVLVFTEYVDTMEYIRDWLVEFYGKGLGCYSGEGGQRWDGKQWKSVSKDEITRALEAGELRALICTDAASEGLNLQAASAVINYDLPWNPSKVEQRIGRMDRIGQKMPDVKVVNLFLRDSVDDKVYKALRRRCGLFEHFVGPMQPVLARARKMLLGQEMPDPGVLEDAAAQVEEDPMAGEIYMESAADATGGASVPLGRAHLETALAEITSKLGLTVKFDHGMERFVVWRPGFSKTLFSGKREVLERDQKVVPLCPLQPKLRDLAKALAREGERLPLVIGSHQKGAFRSSVAYWVDAGELAPVESFEELRKRIDEWDGTYPDPGQWIQAERAARKAAEQHVKSMQELAAKHEKEARGAQVAAARIRLLRELGRYLACLGFGTGYLNTVFYEQMNRDTPGAQRLKKCLERLGGYPRWPSSLCQELEAFVKALPENQRKARLMGNELDAALEDPRWGVAGGGNEGSRDDRMRFGGHSKRIFD